MVYVEHTVPVTPALPTEEYQPAKRRGRAGRTLRWFVAGALVGLLTLGLALAIAWQRISELFS